MPLRRVGAAPMAGLVPPQIRNHTRRDTPPHRHWPVGCVCRRITRAVSGESTMAKIVRTEPGPILSKAVEYHGFVYLPGITARDTNKDIKGQAEEVLAQIDAMLELHGTDKT